MFFLLSDLQRKRPIIDEPFEKRVCEITPSSSSVNEETERAYFCCTYAREHENTICCFFNIANIVEDVYNIKV